MLIKALPTLQRPRGLSGQRALSIVTRLLLPLLALLSPLASVAEAAPRLEVQVIEAKSKGAAHLDPSLKGIEAKLTSSFKSFKSFKLIKRETYQASNGEHTLAISPSLNAKLYLTLKQNGVKLKTRVKRKRGVTRAGYNELFFQAFKWRGKALILAVTARK